MEELLCYKEENPMMSGPLYHFKFKNGHCKATVARGKDWVTIYQVETEPEYRNKGECQKLLSRLKEECKNHNIRFGLWCPMNEVIEHICKKLEIEVYE